MNRFVRIGVTAAATALLVAGVAQAAKPGAATPIVGYADYTGLHRTIELPLVNTPYVLINELIVPNGNYLIDGTVQVFNLSPTTETTVICQLNGGQAGAMNFLGPAEVRLPIATDAAGAAKIPFTGSLARVDGATELTIKVECISTNGGLAQHGLLNAVSVSALTQTVSD